MTPKQIERLKSKIANIKRTLAAEKRLYGCYDDSAGRRYIPLEYYIALADYKGGLTYCRWFRRNFEDDMCDPCFLLEWTIILFKTNKMKEVQQKAFETYCSDTEVFNHFFKKRLSVEASPKGMRANRSNESAPYPYHAAMPELQDFAEWLKKFMESDIFMERSRKYLASMQRLKTESDEETRGYLWSHTQQLLKWE